MTPGQIQTAAPLLVNLAAMRRALASARSARKTTFRATSGTDQCLFELEPRSAIVALEAAIGDLTARLKELGVKFP